jgi:hypothetical protein
VPLNNEGRTATAVSDSLRPKVSAAFE